MGDSRLYCGGNRYPNFQSSRKAVPVGGGDEDTGLILGLGSVGEDDWIFPVRVRHERPWRQTRSEADACRTRPASCVCSLGSQTRPHNGKGLVIGLIFCCCHLNNFYTQTSKNSSAALGTISAWPRTNTETESVPVEDIYSQYRFKTLPPERLRCLWEGGPM